MNAEQLAQSIVRGTYTETSADCFVRDWDRLNRAYMMYDDRVGEIEWSYYRQSQTEIPSMCDTLIELGMHDQLLARLKQAMTDTREAMRILTSKKHNQHTWSLVCEECRYVCGDPYETWSEADTARNQHIATCEQELYTDVRLCVYTLTIVPTYVAQIVFRSRS